MKLFRKFIFISLMIISAILFIGQNGRTPVAAQTTTQKVIAPAGVLDADQAGVTLWHDYGAFALYAVSDTALASLTSSERSQLYMAADMDRILLEAYPFDTQKDTINVPQVWQSAAPAGSALHLVQFVGPIKDEWLKQIEAVGATPVHYVANNAYLVWADSSARDALATMAADKQFLQFSAPYEPFFKLGPTLRDADLNSDELVTVTIQMYKHDGRFATEAIVKNMLVQSLSNWEPILAYQNLIGVVHASDIATLVQQPDVVWVGERLERELHDEVQNQILAGNLSGDQSGPSGVGYLTWLDSFGFSQDPDDYPVVDITDDGIGTGSVTSGDPTFHEFGSIANPTRLEYVSSCAANPSGEGPDGHGHINTSIVGGYDSRTGFPFQDPNGYLRGVGVNPYGRMAGTRIFAPGYDTSGCGGTDTGVIKHSQDNGATISTNSWGCSGCAGTYDDGSQAYDVGVRDADLTESGNQELMIVFSAGNSGSTSGTIGTPGNGKNMLTVGASENQRPGDEDGAWTDGCAIGPTGADDAMDIISFSSRGPAPGGRVKPEVIAPGTHIQGTASTHASYNGSGVCDQYRPGSQTTFAASSGTSHSTPAVAGVSSLVYYWLQNNQPVAGQGGGYEPSPAAVKAYVMNHPTYLTGVSANDTLPSNHQGYGMPNMGVMFDTTPKYVLDQTVIFDNTGETWTWNGAVADPGKPVRIMMVYTDKAGAIGTSPQVNNLNLAATIGATSYLGNQFSGQWSTTGGTADAANNYEAVFLPAGTTGAIEITVTAFNVADDGVPNYGDGTDQDFALVCYNCAQNPDFTILATPSSLDICTPTDAVYDVAVGSILGYAETITLSASGNPVGTTAVFSTNPGTSPFTSTLTIGNTGAATFGSYDIAVTGMGPTSTYTSTVSLNAFTAVPTAPNLTAPGNGDTDVSLTPTFTWDAVSQSQSYDLEVATDAAFSNVVYFATVYGTSHTMTGYNLDAETTYYWRVRAANTCGNGSYASASFTTVLLFCISPNAPISDNTTTSSTLTSARAGAIADLNVYVELTHTYIGDLDITLTNEDTSTSVVLLPTSFGCSGDDIDATFDDESANPITCGAGVPALSGIVQPSGSLADFDFAALAGSWRLDVTDSVGGDVGTLVQWCMEPQFAAAVGYIDGTVTDANTSDPIEGALVTMDNGVNVYTALTDAAGEYGRPAASGTYTVTAEQTNYTTGTASSVAISDGVTTTVDFALEAGWLDSDADDFSATLSLGDSTTLPWTLSNLGTASADFDIRITDQGYTPNSNLNLLGEDVLVVAGDADAATAMETALGNLGYTYLRVTPAVFQGTTVADLLTYKVVIHTGSTADASETKIMEYLDAGGAFYVSDNDLGYFNGTTTFYQDYLQALYLGDDPGIDLVIGEDFMSGLSADISADLWPDYFNVNTEGTRILRYDGGDAAGVAVDRNGYKAVYTSFDFDDIASAADEEAFMDAIMNYLASSGSFWLSTDILTGTISASGTQAVVVTMDAGLVALAGEYYADLVVRNNTPYGDLVIPVTMTVNCPTCGGLEGEITDDLTGDPLMATVQITSTSGFDYTFDDVTAYSIPVPPETYYLTVSATDYYSETATSVVTTGVTNTVDFALTPIFATLIYSPDAIEESMEIGDVVTNTVTVTNTGTADLTFNVTIGGYDGPGLVSVQPVESHTAVNIPADDGKFERGTAALSIEQAPLNAAGSRVATRSLAQYLGTISYATDAGLSQFVSLDLDVPGSPTNIAAFANSIWAGDMANGLVYALDGVTANLITIDTTTGVPTVVGSTGNGNTTGMAYDPTTGNMYVSDVISCGSGSRLHTIDLNTGALTLVGTITNAPCLIGIAADTSGQLYGYDIANDSLLSIDKATGAGTIVGSLGFDANYGQGMAFDAASGQMYLAAFNNAAFQAELRIADLNTGNTTLVGALGIPATSQYGWLAIPGLDGGGSGNWATTPFGGATVAPGATTTFEVVFDASSLYQVGTYTADLNFTGNFENVVPTMPLTMHITCPTCGILEGSITDADTGDPLVADIHVTGPNNFDVTVTGDSYQLAVPAGSYDFTVSAPDYLDETGTAVAVAGNTVTTDFALRQNIARISVDPTAFDVEMVLNDTATYPLDIINDGAAGTPYTLQEMPDFGLMQMTQATLINDGSFEAIPATGPWTEVHSTSCTPWIGDWSGIFGIPAYDGVQAFWAGGFCGAPNNNSAEQTIVIPAGHGELSFWYYALRTDADDPTNNGEAYVQINGADVWTLEMSQANNSSSWTQVTADISAYQGQSVVLTFGAVQGNSGVGNVLFDYVETEFTVSLDVPWLSTDPVTGTVAADSTSTADVIFDTTVLTQTGVYNAFLRVLTDDPVNPMISLPITLTVSDPSASIELDVTVSTSNECGTADSLVVDPGTVVYYCYTVTNTGNTMLPTHTITDTVFGHIDTFTYDLDPGMSESVVYSQTITADVDSMAMWTAETVAHGGLQAMGMDAVSVTVGTYTIYLPVLMKP